MKDIKLRAWDIAEEVMIYSSEEDAVFIIENGVWNVYVREKNLVKDGIEMDVPVWQEADDVEIMLGSSLKDKNAKAIYQGDILKLLYERNYGFAGKLKEEKTVVITFSSGAFWFSGDGVTDCNWHFYNAEDREIIGNIYQNPELLKP